MSTTQQPEAMATAAALEALDMGGVADFVRRQHAKSETLRAKLKVYEDLGGAADDVQLLRMGYAAARLEIESLRAAQPAGAQQPGTAYAALHEEREAFEAMMRSQTFDSLKRLSDGSYESYEARVGWLAWNVRASQGQAPASTSGDFIRRTNEDYAAWCATKYTPEFNSKVPDLHGLWAWQEQQRRMDDLLRQAPINLNCKSEQKRLATLWGFVPAQAAPAAVAGPVAVVKFERSTAGLENEMPRVVSCNWMPDGEYEVYLAAAPTTQPAPQKEPGAWRLVPADATDDMMAAFAKAAAADVDWHNATEADRQEVRDGFCPAYRAMLKAAPQPSPAAQGDALDAARLERERICAAIKAEDDYCVDHGDYMLDSDDCIKIVRGEWVRPDFSVDAARKQGANND